MLEKPDFSDRAQRLGLYREELLNQIKSALDRRYPGQIGAISLNSGRLKVVTRSAVVASELRLRQVEILGELPSDCRAEVNSFHIKIG